MPALTRLLFCGNALTALAPVEPYPLAATLEDVALADNQLDWPALAVLGTLPRLLSSAAPRLRPWR